MQRRGRGADTDRTSQKRTSATYVHEDCYTWRAHLMLAHELEDCIFAALRRHHKLVRIGPQLVPLSNPVSGASLKPQRVS